MTETIGPTDQYRVLSPEEIQTQWPEHPATEYIIGERQLSTNDQKLLNVPVFTEHILGCDALVHIDFLKGKISYYIKGAYPRFKLAPYCPGAENLAFQFLLSASFKDPRKLFIPEPLSAQFLDQSGPTITRMPPNTRMVMKVDPEDPASGYFGEPTTLILKANPEGVITEIAIGSPPLIGMVFLEGELIPLVAHWRFIQPKILEKNLMPFTYGVVKARELDIPIEFFGQKLYDRLKTLLV